MPNRKQFAYIPAKSRALENVERKKDAMRTGTPSTSGTIMYCKEPKAGTDLDSEKALLDPL